MLEPARPLLLVGGGKMGESLLSGLLSAGWRKPEEIVVTGRRQERIDELAERYGVATTLTVTIAKVPGEKTLTNNRSTYTIIWSK